MVKNGYGLDLLFGEQDPTRNATRLETKRAYYHRHAGQINDARRKSNEIRCLSCTLVFSGRGAWQKAKKHAVLSSHMLTRADSEIFYGIEIGKLNRPEGRGSRMITHKVGAL